MLSGKAIVKNMKPTFVQKVMGKPANIVIEPFDPKCIGPNSYDIHLDDKLLVYTNDILDSRIKNPTSEIIIPTDGFTLLPNELYLGSTIEYTETRNMIPKIDGRSSIGRLGILVHYTAGFGDVGFCGTWTLEISVVKPTVVYPGMRIGQLYYELIQGKFSNYAGHYQGQRGAIASRMNNKDNWQK